MTRKGQGSPWRMINLAFGIWALNFLLGYAFALLDETGRAAKVAVVLCGLASIPAFALMWNWARGRDEARMVRLAVSIAGVATLFNILIVLA